MLGGAPWHGDYPLDDANSIWGPPCSLYADIIAQLPRGAQVLDAGCGDGRHSLMFAHLGFSVTAVDIAPSAIYKLERIARQQAIKVIALVESIISFKLEYGYDLIIAHGLLHLLPALDRRQLIGRFKRSTRPDGYNVVVVITNKIVLPSYTSRYMNELFNDGELRKFYDDWDILVDEAYSQPESERIPYRRHFNRVVARNTS